MKCETGKPRLSISKMFVLRLFREPPFQTRNLSLVTRSLSVIIHLNMRSLSKTPSGLACCRSVGHQWMQTGQEKKEERKWLQQNASQPYERQAVTIRWSPFQALHMHKISAWKCLEQKMHFKRIATVRQAGILVRWSPFQDLNMHNTFCRTKWT